MTTNPLVAGRARCQPRPRRRGMLLMVVLLLLSLFLSIGAMLLTIAMRARASARATAAANRQSLVAEYLPREALDTALMSLLRGATTGTNGSVTVSGTLENLLADKYGTSILATSGTITSGSGTPMLTIAFPTVTGTNHISRLNGRVLTMKPAYGDGQVTSYRILGSSTNGTSTICYLADTSGTALRPLPRQRFDIVINGREFTPEGWDAYDDANLWLAQPVVQNGQVTHFNRISFRPNETSLEDSNGEPVADAVDNDNDGIPDGAWIPSSMIPGTVIPSRPSPLGGTISFKVSYLVLDLDGRININAAGIAAPAAGAYAGLPFPTPNDQLGMGYGPADLDASLLFPPTLPMFPLADGTSAFTTSGTAAAGPQGPWRVLSLGGTASTLVSATATQWRVPPVVGIMQGRYGPNAVPGGAGDDAGALQLTSAAGTHAYATTVTGTGATDSVADLQGRMKVFMNSGTMTFFAPTNDADFVNDPYEVRLDADAPRFGAVRRPTISGSLPTDDNPYTVGELEAILRPNDSDTCQLPQRLAAGAYDQAQRLRMMITTDSWDTPGLTGQAATDLENAVATWTSGTLAVSPETAAGLRFNINRLVSTPAHQQEYCKGLYTLAMALSGSTTTPAECAQWAVNALDFRDADSTMTAFEYDTNPSNGWNVDGNLGTTTETERAVAWGVERPELFVSSCTVNSMTGAVSVVLNHPARSAILRTGTLAPVDREVLHPHMAAPSPAPTNTLLMRSLPQIWQVRLVNVTATGTNQLAPIFNLADDSWLTPGQTKTITLTPSGSLPTTGTNRILVERVADISPSANQLPAGTTNQFIAVDELDVNAAGTASAAPPGWVHWPNRPFISQAELALVPTSPYPHKLPATSVALSKPFVLDATYVPSRFAGNALTLPNPSVVALVGLDKLPSNQISKWREPGKVNVNTLVTGSDSAVNNLDNIVWSILMGRTDIPNPFPGTPRTRTVPAISYPQQQQPATPAVPGSPGTPANPAQSTAWLLSLNTGTQATVPSPRPFPVATSPTPADPTSSNRFFSYSQAIRMANTATVRSQVFAVWITVQITDDSPNAPPPVTRRLFAVIDRSIPVGYSPNQDLNARNCILIKRYLD